MRGEKRKGEKKRKINNVLEEIIGGLMRHLDDQKRDR
jgi:hypothetical protein